jgi:hypothetical protein
MLTRWVVAPVLLCAAHCAQAESPETLNWAEMNPGQIYEFKTTGRTYRAQVVEPKRGECLVSASADGVEFSKPRSAFVLGATRGAQAGVTFVIMGEVKVGLGIELAMEDYGKRNRYLTPNVTSITLLSPQPNSAAAD